MNFLFTKMKFITEIGIFFFAYNFYFYAILFIKIKNKMTFFLIFSYLIFKIFFHLNINNLYIFNVFKFIKFLFYVIKYRLIYKNIFFR